MLGEIITPTLVRVEDVIMDYEAHVSGKPNYPLEGFRAALRIFMSALMDKTFELQQKEGICVDDAMHMAEKAGDDLKTLIKIYTDIDTKQLY